MDEQTKLWAINSYETAEVFTQHHGAVQLHSGHQLFTRAPSRTRTTRMDRQWARNKHGTHVIAGKL